jgi:hypothetical protein
MVLFVFQYWKYSKTEIMSFGYKLDGSQPF